MIFKFSKWCFQRVGRTGGTEENEYQQTGELWHKNKDDAGRIGWIKVRLTLSLICIINVQLSDL